MSEISATSVSQAERELALKYVAFAEKEAARIPDIAESTPTRPIAKAAVIGAGTMGGGIFHAGVPRSRTRASENKLLDYGFARAS